LAQLADAYRKIGDVQGNPTNANLGDTAGALASYAKAEEIGERLVKQDPANPEYRNAMALLLQRKADTIAQTGAIQQAVDANRKALEIFTGLAKKSGTLDARQKVAVSHIKLADLLGHPSFPNLGDRSGALEHYREALSTYEGMREDVTTRRYLGIIHERIGKMLEMSGENEQAFASYNKSFAIRESLAADFPANTNARRDLAIAHEKIGDLLVSTKQATRALPRYEQALKIFEALQALDPSNANAGRAAAIEYEKIADTLAGTGDRDRAKAFYTKALESHRRRAASDPMNARARADLERVTARLGSGRGR
jgi:tetratricopeptide (TPR) repeat protein